MSYFLTILKSLGSVVDKVFPFAVGARTKVAVVACPVIGFAAPFIPGKYKPIADIVSGILCASAPLLAAAGLVRDK
jgi:hypothetical protein